jgi:hypothetical protein
MSTMTSGQGTVRGPELNEKEDSTNTLETHRVALFGIPALPCPPSCFQLFSSQPLLGSIILFPFSLL